MVRRMPALFDAIGRATAVSWPTSRCAKRCFLRRLVRTGPDRAVAAAMAVLAKTSPGGARTAVAAALRQAKRQVALAVAIADIAGLWTLDRVTAALSDLADAALALSVRHLLLAACASGALRLRGDHADAARASGFAVLGMGKLGARELNYSSDIDLVLLYDPAAHPDQDGGGLGACFTTHCARPGCPDGRA